MSHAKAGRLEDNINEQSNILNTVTRDSPNGHTKTQLNSRALRTQINPTPNGHLKTILTFHPTPNGYLEAILILRPTPNGHLEDFLLFYPRLISIYPHHNDSIYMNSPCADSKLYPDRVGRVSRSLSSPSSSIILYISQCRSSFSCHPTTCLNFPPHSVGSRTDSKLYPDRVGRISPNKHSTTCLNFPPRSGRPALYVARDDSKLYTDRVGRTSQTISPIDSELYPNKVGRISRSRSPSPSTKIQIDSKLYPDRVSRISRSRSHSSRDHYSCQITRQQMRPKAADQTIRKNEAKCKHLNNNTNPK